MGDDSEKSTVDLTWARIPGKRDRTRNAVTRKIEYRWKSTLPKILKSLGPDQSMKLDTAWENEKSNIYRGEQEVSKKSASVRDAIEVNIERRKDVDWKNDLQRIDSEYISTIKDLTVLWKDLKTDRGRLKLLLDVLTMASDSGDTGRAYDALWCIEEFELYRKIRKLEGYEDTNNGSNTQIASTTGSDETDEQKEEKYKALNIAAKKMKVDQLITQLTDRGVDVSKIKKKKDDLYKVLAPILRAEAYGLATTNDTTATSEGKDKKSKKEKKDKKDKKEKEKKEEKASGDITDGDELADERRMVREYSDKIDLVTSQRNQEPDIIHKQLTDMSHLLPPLSPFTQKFKLDAWQKKVLHFVDERKSVIVCAPTSSGKTVISSYVAAQGKKDDTESAPRRRPDQDDDDDDDEEEEEAEVMNVLGESDSVLFVVPSEPLVWQVAAYFAKSRGLDSKVGIVTDVMTFAPTTRRGKDAHKLPPLVTVGTPLALESALIKIRGFGTHKEMHGQEDRGQMAGGFNYKWVVYDEVHVLNSESPDGAALQRLIRMLDCNFLALSATVGNAEQLRSWFEEVRGTPTNIEVVEAPPIDKPNHPLTSLDLSAIQAGKLIDDKASPWTIEQAREAYQRLDIQMEATIMQETIEAKKSKAKGAKKTTLPHKTLSPAEYKSDSEFEVAFRQGLTKLADGKYVKDVEKMLRTFDDQVQHPIKLMEYSGRFINLQRHVWTEKEDGSMGLVHLHPLAAIDLDFLKNDGFKSAGLPMTSSDSFSLWTKIYSVWSEKGNSDAIKHLDPHLHFPPEAGRITLAASKDYEMVLKSGLVELAQTPQNHELLQIVLNKFQMSDPPEDFKLYDIVKQLKSRDPRSGNDMLPALVFHLDVFVLIDRFHELLTALEGDQNKTQPDFYKLEVDKHKIKCLEVLDEARSASTNEERQRALDKINELGRPEFDKPHEDFVLKAGNRSINGKQFAKICKEVENEDKFHNAKNHALLRGLRRGIGVIINEVTFQAYRRAVMKLATEGKLAVVFSDDSLAFGVNMPFRSVVFCGDMGDMLTPLMEQQMSGRAGRRGLDTQGHLVYAGSNIKSISSNMLSRVADVRGPDPRFHAQFIPEICSNFANPGGYRDQILRLGDRPLKNYVDGVNNEKNFAEVSRDFLKELKFITDVRKMTDRENEDFEYSLRDWMNNPDCSPSGYRPKLPKMLWLMWELRSVPAEGLLLTRLLPSIVKDMFKENRLSNYWEEEDGQMEFLVSILYLIGRTPGPAFTNKNNEGDDSNVDGMEGLSLQQNPMQAAEKTKNIYELPLQENPFIADVRVTIRDDLRTRLKNIEQALVKHNTQLKKMGTREENPLP